ncbi:unnamed protein product [Ectocarpus fasciculatus]
MVSVFLLLLMPILIYMPFITSVYSLYVAFLLLGLFTAITNTGCQIMTRKLHGAEAGPWLGANALAFGLSGALVPLIGYLTGSLFVVYVTLSAVSCATAMFLIILAAPRRNEGLRERGRQAIPARREGDGSISREETHASACKLTTFYRKYKIEFHISGMLFWLICGEVGFQKREVVVFHGKTLVTLMLPFSCYNGARCLIALPGDYQSIVLVVTATYCTLSPS